MNRRAAAARRLVLISWALLALLMVAWHASRLTPAAAVLATIVTLLPLTLPLRGLIDGTRRTYRWAPLVLAPYLAYGLMEWIANPGARPFALATLATMFVAFASVIAWLRASELGQ
jgi:uncharacterized membrane protein